MISDDDPVVSLALCGIRPAEIIRHTGLPRSVVHDRIQRARQAGYSIPSFAEFSGHRLPSEIDRFPRDDDEAPVPPSDPGPVTFTDRVLAFDPHPDVPAQVISDQVGSTRIPGPCAWCGGQILAGTRIRRLEREANGKREVTRFCTACCAAMAAANAYGNEDIDGRRKLNPRGVNNMYGNAISNVDNGGAMS